MPWRATLLPLLPLLNSHLCRVVTRSLVALEVSILVWEFDRFHLFTAGGMLRSECTRPTPRPDMTCTRHAGQHTKLEDHIPRRSSLDPLVHAARVIRAWSPYPRPLLPPRLVRPFTQGSTPHNRAPTAFWPCAFHVASPSTRRLCEARQKRMRQSLAQWPKRRQRWH